MAEKWPRASFHLVIDFGNLRLEILILGDILLEDSEPRVVDNRRQLFCCGFDEIYYECFGIVVRQLCGNVTAGHRLDVFHTVNKNVPEVGPLRIFGYDVSHFSRELIF